MKEMNVKIKRFCKSLLKKVLAFSLVELMISLIAISVIAAAFTPVISKKLKGGNIQIGNGGLSTGADCDELDTSGKKRCKVCDIANRICVQCENVCAEGQVQITQEIADHSICDCVECGVKNCRSCHLEDGVPKCDKCRECMYLENGNTCKTCNTSDPTKTCDGASYKACSAIWDDCAKCSCSGCTECTNNKVWDKATKQCRSSDSCGGDNCLECNSMSETYGKCEKCKSSSRLDPYTGLCRTKPSSVTTVLYQGNKWSTRNGGDTNGPQIPGTAASGIPDTYGVKVVNINTNCTGACCWQGTTSEDPTNSNAGSYSGKTRTVCNQAAAERICSWNAMRLPTQDMIRTIGNNGFNTGKTNLANVSMCYLATKGTEHLIGNNEASQCGGTNNAAACTGAAGNICYPNRYWGENGTSGAMVTQDHSAVSYQYVTQTAYSYSQTETTDGTWRSLTQSNSGYFGWGWGASYSFVYGFNYKFVYSYQTSTTEVTQQNPAYNWTTINNSVQNGSSDQAYSVRCVEY